MEENNLSKQISEELPQGWSLTTIGEVAECLDKQRVPVNQTERKNRQGMYLIMEPTVGLIGSMAISLMSL